LPLGAIVVRIKFPDLGNARIVFKLPVERPFTIDPAGDQHGNGHGNGKTADIYKGRSFIGEQIPPGDFEIIFYHKNFSIR